MRLSLCLLIRCMLVQPAFLTTDNRHDTSTAINSGILCTSLSSSPQCRLLGTEDTNVLLQVRAQVNGRALPQQKRYFEPQVMRDGSQPYVTAENLGLDVTADIGFADARLRALAKRMAGGGSVAPAASAPGNILPVYVEERMADRGTVAPHASPAPRDIFNARAHLDLKNTKREHKGDLGAVMASCVISLITLVVALLLFSCCRQRFPQVYSKNSHPQVAPFRVSEYFFGWIPDSLALNNADVESLVGLDQAMFLRFFPMAIQIFALLSAPMLGVMIWLHAYYGGGAAGNDRLSAISMNNIERDSRLYWLHAFFTWYVVCVVQWIIFAEHKEFIVRRLAWLERLPTPQARTVLLENIPGSYRTDIKLTGYFESAFGDNVVASTHVVKHLGVLSAEYASMKRTMELLDDAQNTFQYTGVRPTISVAGGIVDAITYHKSEFEKLEYNVQAERTAINTLADSPDPAQSDQVCSASAFVTFKDKHYADRTLNETPLKISTEQERGTHVLFQMCVAKDWQVSIPPDPSDVIYNDLLVPPYRKMFLAAFGYSFIFVAFLLCLAKVLLICKLARVEEFVGVWPFRGKVASDLQGSPAAIAAYNGMVHSTLLTIVMGFWPTFLAFIFRTFWVMKSGADIQVAVQNWYFVLLVVFVLLITSIGEPLMHFVLDLEGLRHPLSFFSTCELDAADASHFYLKYFLVQLCFVALFDFSRFAVLMQYLFHVRWTSEERAADLCESEDTDYYGIGSRSARFTFIFVTTLCFCQISPVILVVAIVFFAVCQLMYPYVLVFAEKHKVDSGGVHWVKMLNHMQLGCFLYVAVMAGFLKAKAGNSGPTLVAGSSILCLLISFYRFHTVLLWEERPMQNAGGESSALKQKARVSSRESYQQPELQEEHVHDMAKSVFKTFAGLGEKMQESCSLLRGNGECVRTFHFNKHGHAGGGPASDLTRTPTRSSADTLQPAQSSVKFNHVPRLWSPVESLGPAQTPLRQTDSGRVPEDR